MLNHLNNVTYAGYLQEARVDMLRTHAPGIWVEDLTGNPEEGLVVVHHDITYFVPVPRRTQPIYIECWITEVHAASLTVAYEIFDDASGGRIVHARAYSVLAPYVFGTDRPRCLTPDERGAAEALLEAGPATSIQRSEPKYLPEGHYRLHVRFSDVDVYDHVNNVKYFEYFQEARISLLNHLTDGPSDWGGQVVVANVQVDYLRPICFRVEPYDVWSWIAHVGDRSLIVESEIRSGETVFGRAKVVMVFFDPATQRSAAPRPELRERFQTSMARGKLGAGGPADRLTRACSP